MAIHNFSEFLTTLKDGASKALRIKGETEVTNSEDNPVHTQLTGSTLDQRGIAANKPDPTTVDIGTTYWSVDTDPKADSIEISDGTQWVVM